MRRPSPHTALALAGLCAFAKAIGITRWLFLAPGLAEAYAGADPTGRQTIALLFEAANAQAGGIGEMLGVGLFGAAWSVCAAGLVARHPGAWAKGAAAFLAVTGLGLLAAIPAGFGVELGPVLTITNIAWQFALLTLAIWAIAGAGGARGGADG